MEKQKLILVYFTNCSLVHFSCQLFFLPPSSFVLLFCWHLTVDQRNMKERSGEDTCGKNYITINIRAHLSIISDVRHHRPRIHKIFPWRKLRIRIFLFCVEFCFFSLFFCFVQHRRDVFKHSLIEMMKQIISMFHSRGILPSFILHSSS